jgi:hypothetical protein
MCTVLSALESTMATTQLTRAACCEVCWQQQEEQQAEQKPLRMNWVVVTDESGMRRLRMCWGCGRV